MICKHTNINNIRIQEGGLYSDYYGVAGRVDCIADYKGVLSVIDFKTANKERIRSSGDKAEQSSLFLVPKRLNSIAWETPSSSAITCVEICPPSRNRQVRVRDKRSSSEYFFGRIEF